MTPHCPLVRSNLSCNSCSKHRRAYSHCWMKLPPCVRDKKRQTYGPRFSSSLICLSLIKGLCRDPGKRSTCRCLSHIPIQPSEPANTQPVLIQLCNYFLSLSPEHRSVTEIFLHGCSYRLEGNRIQSHSWDFLPLQELKCWITKA